MELIQMDVMDMSELSKRSEGKIYSLAICISNVEERVTEMYNTVTDTSWLKPLDIIDELTYSSRSQPTIDKVVNEILNNVQSELSEEFGVYMVSDTALSALKEYLRHLRLPLAELIKEKISGNPGFDFHSEATEAVITFGEAKYSGVSNAHGRALRQINEFILAKKDIQELSDLRRFVSEAAIQNASKGIKSYCAAFSIVSDNPLKIMRNALDSVHLKDLLQFEAIFLIGVKVNA